MFTKRISLVLALVSGILTFISCSATPPEAVMGSPAFYWAGARETYRAGDYMKTLQNLDNLLATDNEFVPRAVPWVLVMKSGIAQGYMDSADNYAEGVRNSRTDSVALRRHVITARTSASQLALQFAEDFAKLSKVKGDTITLEFIYPKGSAAPVPQFTRIATGASLTPAETEAAQQASMQRGVLLAVCRAAGAANDTAKTQDILKTGSASVPRATFLFAMADSLYRFAELYGPKKLDEPQKFDALMERAQTALSGVPETKETKQLSDDIKTAIKLAKK